ncbi:hypothetical protein, partial [Flavobacterium cupreum]|uniref:hypothetical protein n=1 Tax=Flavobacterium cupreum TaxID=2133766 RepID=UPI001EE114DB
WPDAMMNLLLDANKLCEAARKKQTTFGVCYVRQYLSLGMGFFPIVFEGVPKNFPPCSAGRDGAAPTSRFHYQRRWC